MRFPLTVACAAMAWGLAPSLVMAQQVRIVDPQGGGDFTTLHEGMNQAADGDIVLVKAGIYEEIALVEVRNRSLTVIGEGEVQARFHTVVVEDLQPQQTVLLRNLDFVFCQHELGNNAGHVWYEDCTLAAGFEYLTGTVALDGCDQVSLTRCLLGGVSATFFPGTPGGEALWARDSRIAAYESHFVGGGGDGSHGAFFPAGHGAQLESSFLFASDCIFEGGDVSRSASGGHGLFVRDGGEAFSLDCLFQGGDGSPPGQGLVLEGSGTHEALAGTPRSVRLSTANRYGSPMTLDLVGEPFDLVYLPHNFDPGFGWLRAARGVFLVDPTRLLNFRLGVLPASGLRSFQLNTPTLPGFEGLDVYTQGWFLGPDGLTQSSPSATTLLDPQF